jgi:hypothetical protein
MDESVIRERAESHATATVAGDLRTAGADLTKAAMAQAGDVMKAMPNPLESSEVTSVQADGEEVVTQIRYSGGGNETIVESRWADEGGTPKIAALKVL